MNPWIHATAAISNNLIAKYTHNFFANKISMLYRKNQVFKTNINIMPQEWKTVDFCVQKHNAKRAGLHRDIRFSYKKRGISLVSKNSMPKVGKQQRVIRTVDHKIEYFDFNGTIPKGEFGAGKVTLEQRSKALLKIEKLKSGNNKIKLVVPDGKYKGDYTIIDLGHNVYNIIGIRKPKNIFLQRNKYIFLPKSSDKLKSIINNKQYIAEEKIDGAHAVANIGDHRTSITGRRLDKDNKIISYNYKLPHLSATRSKKYAGTILRYEIAHKKGYNYVSGILNSNFDNAVDTQSNNGFLNAYIIDVYKAYDHGKPIKFNSYTEKREFMHKIQADLNSNYIKIPESRINNKIKFFDSIIKRNGEGIVIKNSLDSNYQEPWYKVKKQDTYDCIINGFTKGTGKYENKGIGAFIVSFNNKTVKVGTGLNDKIRNDAFNNPNKYIGNTIEVKAMGETKNSLRAPAFVRLRDNK